MIRQPPFPSNGDAQADAIIGVGISATIMTVILFMTVLILYVYLKTRDEWVLMIDIYISEVWLSLSAMANPFFQPFSPQMEIFLILYATIIFISYALRYYNDSNRKKSRY